MATPVSWSYGPWRTPATSPGANPYQNVPSSVQSAPRPQTYPAAIDPGMDVGSTIGTGVTGPDVSGPMTSDERTTYGMVSDPLGYSINAAIGASGLRAAAKNTLGNTVGGFVADAPAMAARKAVTSLAGPYGLATAAMKQPGIMESFMQLLGIQPAQRNIIGPTAVEMQGLADRYGYNMPSPELGWGQMTPGSPISGVSVGPSGFGTTGPSDVTAPSVANPDNPFGNVGGGDGPSGNDSGPGPGGGMGDPGGTEERGGVHKTQPGKPRWAVYGEGKASQEGETGIFVPEYMKRPGQQGNEPQVEQVMRQLLRALRR